ncbi:hypothetical protein BD311DRAFT_1395 [Dichomitus squalens]|uniref:Uncharacterized protein n=1 Tax=Dichomitus squalens TaxID=114155 RepID=A0A4Q9N827_9APHY|nr:hypothetical protein BD311DRAFT_1395 [Dichomitus squalens]
MSPASSRRGLRVTPRHLSEGSVASSRLAPNFGRAFEWVRTTTKAVGKQRATRFTRKCSKRVGEDGIRQQWQVWGRHALARATMVFLGSFWTPLIYPVTHRRALAGVYNVHHILSLSAESTSNPCSCLLSSRVRLFLSHISRMGSVPKTERPLHSMAAFALTLAFSSTFARRRTSCFSTLWRPQKAPSKGSVSHRPRCRR